MIFPEHYRHRAVGTPFESSPGDPCGAFMIPSLKAGKFKTRPMQVIATDGGAGESHDTFWEHVSVTLQKNPATPNWTEMCLIKDLFWEPSASVIQFHPPKDDNISIHHGCLHLWRHRNLSFPMPPKICV